MQTKPKHDRTLIILMGVGAGILLLAAFGLFLAKDMDEPLPGAVFSPTSTIYITSTATDTQTPTATSTGTRRPTRTPELQTDTPEPTETTASTGGPSATATTATTASVTPTANRTATATQAQAAPTDTLTPLPPTVTQTSAPTATLTPAPSLSPTPLDSPIIVSGRVVNQKSPIANITITLEVILSSQETVVLTTTSNNDGAYQFEVNYTNKTYNVVFSLDSNPQLTPASDYVAWSWIESELIDDIEIPDLEISSAPDGDLFAQSQPPDNGSYSASQISFQTPLTFEWSSYPDGEQYWVDLGRQGEDRTLWSSLAVMDLFVDFDGTLDDDTKISQGTYWWAVGSLQSPPGFRLFTYTHDWTLVITP